MTATIGNVALAYTPTPSGGSGGGGGTDDVITDMAAVRLAQAMSSFGAGMLGTVSRRIDTDGLAGHDWLTSGAA